MILGTVTLTQPEGSARQFVATSGTGHHMILDDAAGNTGAKPIELVAIALAGCTAFDVVNILRKKRQTVLAYEVRCEAEQVADPPQVFTNVTIRHLIRGEVDPAAVEDAIRLSEEKYCSVGAMIQRSGAELHTSYEILSPDTVAAK